MVTLLSRHGCGQTPGQPDLQHCIPLALQLRIWQSVTQSGWDPPRASVWNSLVEAAHIRPFALGPEASNICGCFYCGFWHLLSCHLYPLPIVRLPEWPGPEERGPGGDSAGVHVSRHAGVQGSIVEQGLGCRSPDPSRS